MFFKKNKIAIYTLSIMLILCSVFCLKAENAKAAAPVIKVISQDTQQGIVVLRIGGISIPSGSIVLAPVWSDYNWQDDIIWQSTVKKSDGWYVTVKAAEHKNDTGRYNVHFYEKKANGSLSILAGTTFEMKKTSDTPAVAPSFSINNNADNTVTVMLNNLTGVKSGQTVYFPIWGEAGGQNDIVWYVAQKAGNNTWKVVVSPAKHKETGKYNVHAYVYDGSYRFIKGTTFNVENKPVQDKYTGTLKVVDNDLKNGVCRVRLENVYSSTGISEIKIPVWAEANGQNDIIWYVPEKSGSDYYVTINYKNHKSETGKYNIHAYLYDAQGKTHFLGGITANISYESSEPVKLTAKADSSMSTITADLSGYTASSNIKMAVWGTVNGQNDIIWYDAVRGANGTYTVKAPVSKHNESGEYNIHVYDFSWNAPKYIAKTTVNIERRIESPSGWITIDGSTYYYEPDSGKMLKDTVIEGKRINKDGRYTSGSDTLDVFVTEVLKNIGKEGMTQYDMLKEAFHYVVIHFKYAGNKIIPWGADGWQTESAIEMFTKGKGNCYNYAAAFEAIARQLGFNARAISGGATYPNGYVSDTHGWVEIAIDGVEYVCDTQQESAYVPKMYNYYDLFMKTYDEVKVKYRK